MHVSKPVPGKPEEVKKTTLLDRIKRAARAFKGNPINTIEYGLEVKECKKCEKGIRDAESIKVMYICNLKKCDNCSYPSCEHTSDIAFAQNFRHIAGTNIYMEEEHN